MEKAKSLNVLIIDDDDSDIYLTMKFLKDQNFKNLFAASSLREGFQVIEEKNIELVLLDLSLGSTFGLDTLKAYIKEYQNIPVIVMTGLDDDQVGMQAIELGAQDYLIKGSINAINLARTIRYANARKKLESIRNEFINIVSHEIRTPLTILKAGINNLSTENLGPLNNKQKNTMNIDNKSVDRLSKLIANVVDLSRLKSNQRKLNLQSIDSNELIYKACDFFKEELLEKNITLDMKLTKDLPNLNIDFELIVELLHHLMQNAIKYTNSSITISTSLYVSDNESNQIEFTIHDDGPGIAQDKLKIIFDDFIQIDRPQGGAGFQGTGLGLSLCKEIIQKHKGRIWADLDNQNGFYIHFTLPTTNTLQPTDSSMLAT